MMRLYHLTSAEHAISNIKLQRLKIAEYHDLNDPFELLAADVSNKVIRSAFLNWKRSTSDKVGLACFSNTWNNPLLWGHYSDRHRGVALGFDVPSKYAQKIAYVSERLVARFIDGDPSKGFTRDFVEEILRTKYEHWSYEEEWRLFLDLKEYTKDDDMYFMPFDDDLILKEIIIGSFCTTAAVDFENLLEEKESPVNIVQACLSHDNFEVIERP